MALPVLMACFALGFCAVRCEGTHTQAERNRPVAAGQVGTDAFDLAFEPGSKAIYAALAGMTREAVLSEFAGAPFATFKPALAELAVEKLAPVNAEMRRLLDDPAHLDRVLGSGAERATALAAPVLDAVKDIVGLVNSRSI